MFPYMDSKTTLQVGQIVRVTFRKPIGEVTEDGIILDIDGDRAIVEFADRVQWVADDEIQIPQ